MQLSCEIKKKFSELLKELARSYKLFTEDHKAYFKETSKERLIFTSINAPDDLKNAMQQKRESNIPCIYQLYHTSRSIFIVHELSALIHKITLLNCLTHELNPVIEAIVYEYINDDLDTFVHCIVENSEHYKIQDKMLQRTFKRRISSLKKTFTSHVFQFPVVIFKLADGLKLSKNIRLIPTDLLNLTEIELSHYKSTRSFQSNFYLEIDVQTKCSKASALNLAEKARDATYNILKLLATRLSPQAIPLVASNEKNRHLFDFYNYGKSYKCKDKCTTRQFAHLHFDSEIFWTGFNEGKKEEKNLIDISLQIPELLLLPSIYNQRVVDRLERAILWYGDAVVEENIYQQIQKLVSSLETLVNFNEDGARVTDIFKTRVTNINITHTGLSEDIRKKAGELYDARSKIVHGSSIDERLSFCSIDFCSETLLRAIFYLSMFGFEKTGFNSKMPSFLDELPKFAILDCDR